jgi:hypothetical protein
MARESFVFDRATGELVDRDEFYARQPAPKRSGLAAPMIIGDTMPETQHPCTGEYLTSKSAFRALTKAHGCIEVGNDPARLRPRQRPKADKKAIRDSIAKARARFNRGERVNPK